MTQDRRLDGVSRRKFLLAAGVVGSATLAGCSSGGDGGMETQTETATDNPAPATSETEAAPENTPTETEAAQAEDGTLESGGSSTVYPVANAASSYWNANRPADDTEYWPHDKYGIDTDKNLADYWAGLYGLEPGEDGLPPFKWTVGLSHSGTGVRKVRDELYDIGNASGNVEDELPDRDSYEKFVDHVVAVDGQPLVVSQEIKDAGVTKITGDELKGLYKGEITNWSQLGGPNKPVRVLGRVKDSGTRTAFVSNVWGNPKEDTQVKNRFGQNQRLAQAVAQADNAISYLALAFVNTDGLAPIALEWEGTTYKYQDDQNGLDSKNYPLSRDLHM
jgi:phosphate transport system substrate-binding protein